jgi:hypothetical protein
MLRYLYLIIFLIIANAGACFAAKPAKQVVHKAAILKTDSSTVNIRVFDSVALKGYSKQPEFKYDDTDTGPSLWTRFWHWLSHLFDFLTIHPHVSSGFLVLFFLFLKYLFIVLGLATIAFFIFKMAGIDMLNIFRRKPRTANLPYSESLENIHEINFDTEIENAVAQHNYRLAVRLLYLKCLKQLNDASLIKWQPEKTNGTYVNELNDIGQRSNFKLLTRQFEYVWYGDFAIDGDIFKHINVLFQKFKNDMA